MKYKWPCMDCEIDNIIHPHTEIQDGRVYYHCYKFLCYFCGYEHNDNDLQEVSDSITKEIKGYV